MYNRYIPSANGVYERHCVQEATVPCEVKNTVTEQICVNQPQSTAEPERQSLPKNTSGMDLGDLLLLCIIILLMVDSDQEDLSTILITAAAFLFLQ